MGILGKTYSHGLGTLDYIELVILILPPSIIGVNADYRARSLVGKVAEQNYQRVLEGGKKNIK